MTRHPASQTSVYVPPDLADILPSAELEWSTEIDAYHGSCPGCDEALTIEPAGAGHSIHCQSGCDPDVIRAGLVRARCDAIEWEERQEAVRRSRLVVAAARERLYSFHDPWLLHDPWPDDPKAYEKQSRIDNCEKGRSLRLIKGFFVSGGTRCNYRTMCPRCAEWQVGVRNPWGKVVGSQKAWLAWYDRMDPPLFSGTELVYWQPVYIGDHDPRDVPEVRRLADRARDRKVILWTRIDTPGVVNYFSAVDLHVAGDTQESWSLAPRDALRFFFDEMLVPLVVQRKPTAGKGLWKLPTDKAMDKELASESGAADPDEQAEPFDPYALVSQDDEPAFERWFSDPSVVEPLRDAANEEIRRRWPNGAPSRATAAAVLAEQEVIVRERRRRFDFVQAGA